MKLKIIEMIANDNIKTKVRIFNSCMREFTESNDIFSLSVVNIGIDLIAYILYEEMK